MIKIGTSGYSFEDWRGVFYPEDIGKGKMLDFYAQHFDVVEINSTYYRIPHPRIFHNMVRKTSDEFEFIVKVNKATTHEGKDPEVVGSFRESIRPMTEEGKLKGVLAQFPWGFRNTPANRDYLKSCRERIPDIPYFVEFRHKSWLTEEMGDLLRDNQLSFVCVDEPQIGNMMPPIVTATTDLGYIRLHGRNKENWWDKGGDRYDYLYSEEELKEWAGKAVKLAERTEKTYLFFNNCHRGQAVENAQEMKEILKPNLDG